MYLSVFKLTVQCDCGFWTNEIHYVHTDLPTRQSCFLPYWSTPSPSSLPPLPSSRPWGRRWNSWVTATAVWWGSVCWRWWGGWWGVRGRIGRGGGRGWCCCWSWLHSVALCCPPLAETVLSWVSHSHAILYYRHIYVYMYVHVHVRIVKYSW